MRKLPKSSNPFYPLRNEAGNADFSLRDVLESAVDAVQPQARRRGLQLNCYVPRNVSDNLQGDSGRLRQIVLNLVRNAVKYTPRGGDVAIRVKCEEENSGIAKLHFTVSDTGVGIARDRQETTFGTVVRRAAAASRKKEGLASCKEHAERLHGSIGVESEPGLGSTFYFTAPFAVNDQAASRRGFEPGTVAPQDDATGLRVLLAEHDVANQSLVSGLLESRNHSLAVADSAEQASEAVAGEQFDLIIMDLGLPLPDGTKRGTFIGKLRKAAGGEVPMIAIGNGNETLNRTLCRNAGIGDPVACPVLADASLSAVERAVMASDPGAEADVDARKRTVKSGRSGHRISVRGSLCCACKSLPDGP